jgi:hypothetical protein
LENYYHSSEYSYNFVLKLLQYLKDNNIEKKIIIHTLKTTQKNIDFLIKEFDNVLLIINTDIEYFFLEFFHKKTQIKDITNIMYRQDN